MLGESIRLYQPPTKGTERRNFSLNNQDTIWRTFLPVIGSVTIHQGVAFCFGEGNLPLGFCSVRFLHPLPRMGVCYWPGTWPMSFSPMRHKIQPLDLRYLYVFGHFLYYFFYKQDSIYVSIVFVRLSWGPLRFFQLSEVSCWYNLNQVGWGCIKVRHSNTN